MEARNRPINEWYSNIIQGSLRLPDFQRYEAWDRRRICSLFNTVIKNLPLGITLILVVGDNEQFDSRTIVTAPVTNNKIQEHLLDGQQRLTALWRVLHNNYELESYYVYLPEYDEVGLSLGDEQFVFCRARYHNKRNPAESNNTLYPLWCDIPEECLKRGMIPTHLLKPENIDSEITLWVNEATKYKRPTDNEKLDGFYEWKELVSKIISHLRFNVYSYNLPFLSLPPETPKDVALEVFINMNTNSKPLSTYDIIVAEVENKTGKSIHNLQEEMNKKHPEIINYADLQSLILNTSSLLQDKQPSQKGAFEMDETTMITNWGRMEKGLSQMAIFLHSEGILDKNRLPTNAVLSVIAALYDVIPEQGDKRGMLEILLKKYLWSAFFTDRYENSAATNAYYDYLALKKVILEMKKENGEFFTESDVPVLNRQLHPLSDAEELLTAGWPKNVTIRGRAILSVACRLGAHDFASGQRIDRVNIKNRHYHHIFPDALLKEAGIESFMALNCALISDNTNLNIGRKDPLQYLKERYDWVDEETVNDRLNSHLIPIIELSNGGYEEPMSIEKRKDKIRSDFETFRRKRALFFSKAAALLSQGRNISAIEIIKE